MVSLEVIDPLKTRFHQKFQNYEDVCEVPSWTFMIVFLLCLVVLLVVVGNLIINFVVKVAMLVHQFGRN